MKKTLSSLLVGGALTILGLSGSCSHNQTLPTGEVVKAKYCVSEKNSYGEFFESNDRKVIEKSKVKMIITDIGFLENSDVNIVSQSASAGSGIFGGGDAINNYVDGNPIYVSAIPVGSGDKKILYS